jgi:hypothetical protein
MGQGTDLTSKAAGSRSSLWKRKAWWLLPFIVFFLLLAAIYILVHLSASDPETYQTTSRTHIWYSRLC